MMGHRLLLLCASAALAGCDARPASTAAPTLVEMPVPAGIRSAEPFLHVDAGDRVHMTWIERTSDSMHAVRYARLDGDRWTPASTIVERPDLFVNWADFPAVIAAPSGRLVAHWLQRGGPGKFAYDVRYAHSTDGTTWTGDAMLHRDSLHAGEHGFVAWWAGSGDSVHAAWLDGRAMSGKGHGEGGGAMSVRSAAVAPDGSLGAEVAIDLRSCECCQVNAAVASRGPVVVYRDRSEGEIRNIAVVRLVDGTWTEPAHVYDDNWHVEGCPVNGPAIAARGDTVVVAWFTGAQDTARVRVAWSFDGGATFAAPTRIDTGDPVGRVDVELLPSGGAAVAWLERIPPERGEVRVRRVGIDGTLGAPFTVAATAASRPAGFPKLVRRGNELLAAWTVPGDSGRVHLGRLAIAELP